MENKTMKEDMPTINLIAAVALDGSIGTQGKLLWKIPKDLEFYKAKTLENVIIMGLETYKTLPKVALKDRHTVVVCKIDEHLKSLVTSENTHFAFTIQHALRVAKDLAKFYNCNIFIAGGASIYEQMMRYCDYAFITWVDKTFEKKADKFFSIPNFLTTFELISESIWHGKHARAYPPYKFVTYKRKKL